MGGIGSGRRNQRGKATTDDLRSIDIRHMQREGMLVAGKSSSLQWLQHGNVIGSVYFRANSGHVLLSYARKLRDGETRNESYPVITESTPCHLGGERIWFVCPAQGCGKRVAKLYIGTAGIFACRHCYRLVYRCQRESSDELIMRRMDKIIQRLNWHTGCEYTKPKGMQWRSYQRLLIEHDALTNELLSRLAQ